VTMKIENADHTTATDQRPARAYVRAPAAARGLTFSYITTAITRDKTFRERQISICLNKTPREPYVNTKPRACAYARASKDPAPHGAGTLPLQT